MAALSAPRLTITSSPTTGMSTVRVDYEITFNGFDKSIDQPYTEIVRLIGDDTGVAGDPAAAAPDDVVVSALVVATVRASMIAAPATTLKRSHSREVRTSLLNEDTTDAPNADEIRALVTLNPQLPVPVGPRESNIVMLQLV